MRGNAAARRAARTRCMAGTRRVPVRAQRRGELAEAGGCQPATPETKARRGSGAQRGAARQAVRDGKSGIRGSRRHRLRNARVTSRDRSSPAHAPLQPTCAGAHPTRQRGCFSARLQAHRRLPANAACFFSCTRDGSPQGRDGGALASAPAARLATARPSAHRRRAH